MIDLRSDTFTVPDDEMRKVIASAPVGDDVFREDPSVNELQEYTADFFGKEAALFVPSGTMGNQIGIAVNTKSGDEVIIESQAHIFYYEAAAPAMLSRVQLRCIDSDNGMMEIEKIKSAIRPPNDHYPPTTLICLENTHNRHSGSIIELDYIYKVAEIAGKENILLHCDGARIWHAAVERGASAAEFADPFETVSVCLSKGLGAPVGSLLVGPAEKIEKARKLRKIFGGGMRQCGIIAAAGLYAIRNNYPKLKATHQMALDFAKDLDESDYISVDFRKIQTNIVIFTHSESISSGDLENELKKNGVLVIPFGDNTIRAVFHFQISEKQSIAAADIIKKTVESLVDKVN